MVTTSERMTQLVTFWKEEIGLGDATLEPSKSTLMQEKSYADKPRAVSPKSVPEQPPSAQECPSVQEPPSIPEPPGIPESPSISEPPSVPEHPSTTEHPSITEPPTQFKKTGHKGVDQRLGRRWRSIYGGHVLFRLNIERKELGIEFGQKVLADIGFGNRRPRVRIKSFNANRATPALDALYQVYAGTGDVRLAILACAKAADQSNLDIREGISPTSRCDCDSEATNHVLHCCKICTAPTICKLRRHDQLNRLGYPSCLVVEEAKSKVSRPSGQTLAQRTIRRSFETSFDRECAIRPDIDRETKDAIKSAGLNDLMQRLVNLRSAEYVDEYTGEKMEIAGEVPRPLGQNPSFRCVHPATPSVDAVHARSRSEAQPDVYLTHAESNLAITSMPLQYAKYSYAVGMLQVIAHYLNLDNPSKSQEIDFLGVLHGFHLARLMIPYFKVARNTGDIDEKQYELELAQLIAGKVARADSALENNARRLTKRDFPKRLYVWNEATRGRLQRLWRQIASKYGKTLAETTDGCPWPFAGEMPKDWGWDSFYCLLHERKQRMLTDCNKHHETMDTEQSLFAEIIYQHCTNDPQ